MGIQCTGGFANMSEGKLRTYNNRIKALMGRVLVGIKCTGTVRIINDGK